MENMFKLKFITAAGSLKALNLVVLSNVEMYLVSLVILMFLAVCHE